MDRELEELKRKRIEQLKQAYAERLQGQNSERQQAEMEASQQLEAIEDAVKAHLTKEALQRYGTLKLAHPETAIQLVIAVAQAIEAGKLRGMLGDEQLKEVLQQLSRLAHKGKAQVVQGTQVGRQPTWETKITRI
ncbi:hypothetical protein HYY73_00040 [Candidatus Woesearchaeota archaeon]|nr:hypothetical protein [Candidatus Woesearchaeota archaeon]